MGVIKEQVDLSSQHLIHKFMIIINCIYQLKVHKE